MRWWFAIHPEDLKRVATPELVDDLTANAMSLHLADERFARGTSTATFATRPSERPSAGTMPRSASGSLVH